MMNYRNDIITELRQALDDKSTVLFIGSGVSAWSGLPRWDKLLSDLADIIVAKGHNADVIRENITAQPLFAASCGTMLLTNREFADFIKRECCFDTAKPHKIHRLITQLGPTCYVTTNYDHLLEQALQKYSKKTAYKKVLNNQPLDCSSILPIKANEYIFKLHGDMDVPESIVLNTKQYEAQYSSGNRIFASRTLENILLTRTVVFIGFGLKDPDFLHIIAKIKNEFHQIPCPHYALVLGCDSIEQEYWKEQYNITLVPFGAKMKEKEEGNYGKLIPFLEELIAPRNEDRIGQSESNNKLTKLQQNSLKRYINALVYTMEIETESIFPLKLELEQYSRLTVLSTAEIISELPEHSFVLTGNPGAGKSFFLRQYCQQVAISLNQQLERAVNKKNKHKIPVYVDLKFYKGSGSIATQIVDQFPDNIPVMQWLEEGRFILFLDSYNEVPEQYRENKSCFSEINKYNYRNIIVVGDRLGDNFEFGFYRYQLLSIDTAYIENYLFENGVFLQEDKECAVLTLLEKPLFFQLLTQKKIQVNDATTPRGLYDSYFKYLNDEFQSSFQEPLDLKNVFLPFAYNLSTSGAEGFVVDDLIAYLDSHTSLHKLVARPIEIINWLIEEQQFLAPSSGNSLSLFHQSITEFLAGNYLAVEYTNNNAVVLKHLRNTSLDYVLIYATEFLTTDEARQYINSILDWDMILAIRACTYLEKDAEQTVQLVLEYVDRHIFNRDFDFWMDFNETDIPVTNYHEPILRRLMRDKDIVGGKAASLLIRIFGAAIVDAMLEEMFSNIGCYNYLSAIADALSPYVTPQLFHIVMNRLAIYSNASGADEDGFSSPFANLASELPFEEITQYISTCGDYSVLNDTQKNVIRWIIYESNSQETFDWALSQFKSGYYSFVFPLYLKIRFDSEKYDLQQLDNHLLNAITILIEDSSIDNDNKRWAIELLYSAYQHCPSFSKEVRAILKGSEGYVRLAVLYAIGKNRTITFFKEFSSLLYWHEMPTELIQAFELADWSREGNNTDHIIEILIEKYPLDALSTFLEDNLSDSYLYRISLETFLKLMVHIQKKYIRDDMLKDLSGVGAFLSTHIRKEMLFDFYRTTTPRLKRFFNYCVFNQIDGIELSNFTIKEINALIQELAKVDYDYLHLSNFTLSNIATEAFVEERLLPLMQTEQELLQKNLNIVIRNTERQLGHRYLYEVNTDKLIRPLSF